MMLFGEKYGDIVRVLDIGSTTELCGGTHVARTGDIGFFSITAEGGVAAGVRRVEAVTGMAALHYVQGMEATLGGVAGTLRVTSGEVPARVEAMLAQVRELEKELAAVKGKLASAQGDELSGQAVVVAGVHVLSPVQKVTIYKEKQAVAPVVIGPVATQSVASPASAPSPVGAVSAAK
jgi:alanyl-tRNA synthetase